MLFTALHAQNMDIEGDFFEEPSFEENQESLDFTEDLFENSELSTPNDTESSNQLDFLDNESDYSDLENFNSSTELEASNNLSPSISQKAIVEELKIKNRKEPKKIPHPNARKGLERITSENVYIYDVEESKQESAIAVQFGGYDPVNLQSETANFADLYSSGVMLQLDYEWNWLEGWAGSIDYKLGSGLFISEGNAVFVEGSNAGTPAKESLFFFLFPNQTGLNYKMKLWDDQTLVPYAEGGAGYYVFAEKRDDDLDPAIGRWAASPIAYWAGGLAINLNSFSRKVSRTLDREYGINKIYLNIEFRSVIGLSDKWDLSSDYANAGFLVEY